MNGTFRSFAYRAAWSSPISANRAAFLGLDYGDRLPLVEEHVVGRAGRVGCSRRISSSGHPARWSWSSMTALAAFSSSSTARILPVHRTPDNGYTPRSRPGSRDLQACDSTGTIQKIFRGSDGQIGSG